MSWERLGGLRAAIAQLAAQIMYGEEVKQYFTAKRMAAKRLLGQTGARGLRYRPRDLPSNGEIHEALLALVEEIEGDNRVRRLFAMRIVALETMAELTPFFPRLIGSVSTGHVREGSDIDLHVFADHPADVVSHVQRLGWTHETQAVSIMKQGKVREYTHVHIADIFPVELTVYALQDLRTRPRSSTDGKPIHRLSETALRALVKADHPELWARYETTGETPTLEELLEPDDLRANAGHASLAAFQASDCRAPAANLDEGSALPPTLRRLDPAKAQGQKQKTLQRFRVERLGRSSGPATDAPRRTSDDGRRTTDNGQKQKTLQRFRVKGVWSRQDSPANVRRSGLLRRCRHRSPPRGLPGQRLRGAGGDLDEGSALHPRLRRLDPAKAEGQKQKTLQRFRVKGVWSNKIVPATSYSPTRSLLQYHRLRRA